MKILTSLSLILALASQAAAGSANLNVELGAQASPRGLALGDLNGDGLVDAVVANFGSGSFIGQACSPSAGSLSVIWGGTRGPRIQAPLVLPAEAPRGVTLGDVDGDGRLDLLVTYYCASQLAVYKNTGQGFAAAQTVAVGHAPVAVATLPFKGGLWIAVANFGGHSISLLRTQGGVLEAVGTYSVGQHPTDVKFVGGKDLWVASLDGIGLGHWTLEGGAWKAQAELPLPGQPCKLAVGDLNGDGQVDLAVTRFSDNKLSLLLGGTTGLSREALTLDLGGQRPNGLSFGLRDGKPVLVVAERDSDKVEVVGWSGGGLQTIATTQLEGVGPVAAFGPVEAALGDFNGDGKADLLATHMRSGRLFILLGR